MADLTLKTAQIIIESALAGGRTGPQRRIAIAVCDAGGHPLALGREEEAAPLLAHIAQAKAFTCIAYGKSTDAVREWAEETPIWFHGVARVAEQRMGLPLIGSKGGVYIRDGDGRALGAVGVAGEAGEQDEKLAVTGIEAAGFVADAG
ncbi:MAG: heme-binding protein [Hyphomicrobiales bacterium]|nr:heme-binding protein [Hyphomicrobiales bacterium]